ncbi:MAG TPA: MoaD/ThiS family protein [Dehalococcoidales bacterium]|nr:MoaD/ThiS family protein [Dehalococcoidales bacterium]
MSVNIEISSIFARYAGNETSFKVEGKTIGECLRALAKRYPELGKMVIEKNGELSPSFEVFLNSESAYPNTMAHPVKSGDKINIVLIVHGG